MSDNNNIQHYTIRETAKLSGLPESTLRYYETIGLIHPIHRDSSSKHRVYSEDDVNLAIAMSCLNAIGMSIEDMRLYIKNQKRGTSAAGEQVELLETQKKLLVKEVSNLVLRQRYVEAKIAYWNAIRSGNVKQIEIARKQTLVIAQELQLPMILPKEKVNDSAAS